jgi:hypothetical protein
MWQGLVIVKRAMFEARARNYAPAARAIDALATVRNEPSTMRA